MTTNTNTRRTRKTTDKPVAPATDAPTPDVTDQAADTTDQATTYTIPDWSVDMDRDAYVASVGEAYRNADKGTKAAMRAAWARFQSDALRDLDIPALDLLRHVNGVLVTTKTPVEVDPTDAYVRHIRALRLAVDDVRARFAEEFTGRFGADAEATIAHLDAALDAELSAEDHKVIGDMATKLAAVKSGSRRTGPTRSVEAHIRSALQAAPAGTILTCAQIHNHRSDAYGPDDAPSVGAIGAAWGRESDDIESTHNESKVKGFRIKA